MTDINSILTNYKSSTGGIKTDAKHLMYLYLLDYIKANCATKEIVIDNNIRMEYLSDFYGLLQYHTTNSVFNYINLLLNDYKSSNEFDGEKTTIIILDELDDKARYIKQKIMSI